MNDYAPIKIAVSGNGPDNGHAKTASPQSPLAIIFPRLCRAHRRSGRRREADVWMEMPQIHRRYAGTQRNRSISKRTAGEHLTKKLPRYEKQLPPKDKPTTRDANSCAATGTN